MRTLGLRFLGLYFVGVALFAVPGTDGARIASAGGGACHQPPDKMDEVGTLVRLSRNCFSPAVLRVEPGAEVRFQNDDEMIHHVAGVATQWGTIGSTLALGDDAEFTFAEPGTYPYSCNLHVGMTGAIVVGDGVVRGGSSAQVPVEKLSQRASPIESTGGASVEPIAARASDNDTSSTLLAALAGAIAGSVAVMAGLGVLSLRKR